MPILQTRTLRLEDREVLVPQFTLSVTGRVKDSDSDLLDAKVKY